MRLLILKRAVRSLSFPSSKYILQRVHDVDQPLYYTLRRLRSCSFCIGLCPSKGLPDAWACSWSLSSGSSSDTERYCSSSCSCDRSQVNGVGFWILGSWKFHFLLRYSFFWLLLVWFLALLSSLIPLGLLVFASYRTYCWLCQQPRRGCFEEFGDTVSEVVSILFEFVHLWGCWRSLEGLVGSRLPMRRTMPTSIRSLGCSTFWIGARHFLE